MAGLYENIHKRRAAKKKSGGRMRRAGETGAPTDQAFRDAAKTAEKRKKEQRTNNGYCRSSCKSITTADSCTSI